MNKNIIKINSTSFEINKLITSTQLFSKLKLSLSARLVLRCIVDFWNYKMSCAYPTQLTIAKCTGLTDVAVGKAVKELNNIGLIEKQKKNKRIYYYFTLKLLGYLNLTPKIIYVNTQKNLCNIPNSFYDNNILKDNENIFLNTSQNSIIEDELISPKQMAEITVKKFANNPVFYTKVAELKEKFGL